MKKRELVEIGIPYGNAMEEAVAVVRQHCGREKGDPGELRERLVQMVAEPDGFVEDPLLGKLAAAILATPEGTFTPRTEPAPWRQWGSDLEDGAVNQMRHACDLPVAVAGALMPDAHQGYGLPIGGVLATEGSVIPYAVGVDIACRMKLTVLDLSLIHI